MSCQRPFGLVTALAALAVIKLGFAGTNTVSRLSEPDRVIHKGDMLRIRVSQPARDGQFARTHGSLPVVEKNGDVATPEGSFVKAAGLTLLGLRTNLVAMYAGVRGYEGAKVEVEISSCPYKVIRYDPKKVAAAGTNAPPATILPRNFRAPLTVWQAIQEEGGLPVGVEAKRVCVMRDDDLGKAERTILDCSGKDGAPDGGRMMESGDFLFLIPGNSPLGSMIE